jgi:hypothetical protein
VPGPSGRRVSGAGLPPRSAHAGPRGAGRGRAEAIWWRRARGSIIVEAMKMENELRAPCCGRVSAVSVSEGMAVEKDTVLVEFETGKRRAEGGGRMGRSRGGGSARMRARSRPRLDQALRPTRGFPCELYRGDSPIDPERISASPGLPLHPRGPSRHVPGAALDHAPVCRVRDGGGDERALPLPPRPGQTGLSVAFDLPTQMGYDSDHPMAAGEVGRAGVAIDSLEDMRILFDGISLDQVSTSMTINATAAILLALYIAVAEEKGIGPEAWPGPSRTTSSRSTSRAAPTSSGGSLASAHLRPDGVLLGTRSLAGIPSRSPATTSARPGATAPQEVAFTFANGLEYVRGPLKRASMWRTSPPASPSSSPPTTTSSKRSRSSGRPGASGPG